MTMRLLRSGSIAILVINISLLIGASSIKINEIFYNPEDFPEHLYEWIEIYNPSDNDAVDVSDHFLQVGTRQYHFYPFNRSSGVLPPDSYAVLMSSGVNFMREHPAFDALLLEFEKTVRLSNSGKTIVLLDRSSTTIETVSYQPSWNNNVEEKSIERIDPYGDPNDPLNWHESVEFGGSPGTVNSQDAPGEDDGGIVITVDRYPLVITEVSPSESGGRDWIELFVVEDTDLSSYALYEKETQIKQFPSLAVKKGDYCVVWVNSQASDETTDTNGNGYIDLYSTDAGLTGTDNVLSVRDMNGGIIDALIFSNRDGGTFVPQTSYDACFSAGVWGPAVVTGMPADYENGAADWSGGSSGISLVRRRRPDGLPDVTLPSQFSAWQLNRYPDPGGGYGSGTGSEGVTVETGSPNPFSPDDTDPARRFALLNFSVPHGSVKDLYIFDVHGRKRIQLIDDDTGSDGQSWHNIDQGQVVWDGRDRHGEKLTVGIYIVYMEASDSSSGAQYTGRDTVVIGRKLK